jgi:hypothetical protein
MTPPPFDAPQMRLAITFLLFASWGCGGGGGDGDPSGPDTDTTPSTLQIAAAPSPRVGVPGGPLGGPVVVQVRNASGAPLAGVQLSVQVLEGGGWASASSIATDGSGTATVRWYAGPDPAGGSHRLRIRSGSLEDEVQATAAPAVPGERYLGDRGFIEYTPGTLPLVITAPHGGTLLPGDIPDRSYGTFVRDLATDTLALLVADSLEALTGARPHLVRVHLHRRKLDANRDLEEAAQGDARAVLAWREFHAWTEAAMAAVRAQHVRGLYMDVHGHGHDVQRLELGYLLSASELALDDDGLDQPAVAGTSSLREVPAWVGEPPHEVIRGPASLGAWFQAEGYPAVPSPEDPHPAGAPYFTGGYNTARYGCRGGGPICGFQLEANRNGVRDSGPALGAFAGATARVLEQAIDRYLASGSGSP